MAEPLQEIVITIGEGHAYETLLRRAFNEGDLQGQLRVLPRYVVISYSKDIPGLQRRHTRCTTSPANLLFFDSLSEGTQTEVLRVTLADGRSFVVIDVNQFPDANQVDRQTIAQRLRQFVSDHWDVISNATELVMINSTQPRSLPLSPIDCFWDAYASHATSPGTRRATPINRVIYANIYMDSVAFAHPVNRHEGFVNQLRQVQLQTQVRELFEFRSDSCHELERPYNRSYLYPSVIVEASYTTTRSDLLALSKVFYEANGDELYPNAAATHFLRNQADRPSARDVLTLKRQYERKNAAYFPLGLDELVKQLLKRYSQ